MTKKHPLILKDHFQLFLLTPVLIRSHKTKFSHYRKFCLGLGINFSMEASSYDGDFDNMFTISFDILGLGIYIKILD